MKTKAAIREHHLNAAFALAQEAEQLEAYAESKRNIRLEASTPASVQRLATSGTAAACKALTLRAEIQQHLILVTSLTDYSEPSRNADDRWLLSLQEQARQAKLKAMSDRQIADFVAHKSETNRQRNAA
jgi:hypothetical protein